MPEHSLEVRIPKGAAEATLPAMHDHGQARLDWLFLRWLGILVPRGGFRPAHAARGQHLEVTECVEVG